MDRMNQLNKFFGENDDLLNDDDDEGFLKLQNVNEQGKQHKLQTDHSGREKVMDDMVLYDNDFNLL